MSASKRPRILEKVNDIRSELFYEKNIDTIKKLWKNTTSEETFVPECNVKIIHKPFPVCLIYDLAPKAMITAALDEFDYLHFNQKNNDLFEFQQTLDLVNITELEAVNKLYSFMCVNVFQWVEKTFVPGGLDPDVAAVFTSYSYGDRLLCHDDQCEGRHIAFVLYLTEDWEKEDGGNLELFDCDENGDPNQVIVTIPAKFNTLVLFEVSNKSFHQVSEILSKTKKRLSLNGWFHKEGIREVSRGPIRPLVTTPAVASEIKLQEYMFDQYLSFRNQIDIKSTFVANSEIQLDNFLQTGLFSKLIEEFSSDEVVWKSVGPPLLRKYEVADETSLPPAMSEMLTLFQSYAWFKFLRNITGVDLTAFSASDLTAWEKGIEPSCRIELQRWTPGCYTLLCDEDKQFDSDVLETFLRLPFNEGEIFDNESDNPEAGHIVYIEKEAEQDECLLHLGYKMNSLGLVYREQGVLRFTKYLKKDSASFYQIQCSYVPWAPPEDDPDLKHMDSENELNPSDDEIPNTSDATDSDANETLLD